MSFTRYYEVFSFCQPPSGTYLVVLAHAAGLIRLAVAGVVEVGVGRPLVGGGGVGEGGLGGGGGVTARLPGGGKPARQPRPEARPTRRAQRLSQSRAPVAEPHLHSRLTQLRPEQSQTIVRLASQPPRHSLLRQLLPGVDVWVLRLLEVLLQHLQLLAREGGPRSPYLPPCITVVATILVCSEAPPSA